MNTKAALNVANHRISALLRRLAIQTLKNLPYHAHQNDQRVTDLAVVLDEHEPLFTDVVSWSVHVHLNLEQRNILEALWALESKMQGLADALSSEYFGV